jgi:hypothetical protein
MAKVRRKSNGCRRGAFKRKKMGKGWLRHRRVLGTPAPIDRSDSEASSDESRPADETSSGS